MLELNEIKRFYPESLHSFDSFLLKEYLQYKILEIIFSGQFANKLCFIGGTNLRIIHENQRFSEDLDFDNFNLSFDEFSQLGLEIQDELSLQGYEVEIRNIQKGAFHCYVKFPALLMKSGLSGYKDEKILIQLDSEAQGYNFIPETYILNKFDVFCSVKTASTSILLAQKFYAVLNRKRNKGRDFYDIIFLLGLNTSIDYDFLKLKTGIEHEQQLKKRIIEHCNSTDMKAMAEDVRPFLFNSKDLRKIELFAEYIKQQKL